MKNFVEEIRSLQTKISETEVIPEFKFKIKFRIYIKILKIQKNIKKIKQMRKKKLEDRLTKSKKIIKYFFKIFNSSIINNQCPYENCNKLYGSEVSLNLHIKLKHKGGNKTDREKLAV